MGASPQDWFEHAQRHALQALDDLEAAWLAFDAAIDTLRPLITRASARLAGALPAGAGTVKTEDIQALRAFAGASDVTGEDTRFLDALAHLVDLSAEGADDHALMAAEDTVLAFPAAARFRAIIFAASRGRIHLGGLPAVHPRLAPWLPGAATPGRPLAAAPGAPSIDTGLIVDEAARARTATAPDSGTDNETTEVQTTVSDRGSGREPPDVPAERQDDTAAHVEPAGQVAPAPKSGRSDDQEGGQPDEPVAYAPGPEGTDDEHTHVAAVAPDDRTGTRTEPDPQNVESGRYDTEAVSAQDARVAPVPPAPTPDVGGTSTAVLARDEAGHDEATTGHRKDVEAAYARMFAAGRWGLARWLARAVGDMPRADALEAIAFADGARSATGPLALAFTDKLEALSPQRLSGDRPAQLLAVSAATRAALVAPFSGVAATLTQLARTFDADAPTIAIIADAAAEAALHGVAFTGDVVMALGGTAAIGAKIAAVVEEANSMLRRTGRTRFSRADHIWAEWVTAGGPVHDLLAAVAANDPARLGRVRTAVFDYSKDSVQQQHLRASDDRYRGHGKPRVEGPARVTLLSRLRDALRIASAWTDLQQATTRVGADNHEASVAGRLRDLVRSQGPGLEAALAERRTSADPMLAGAAYGAERLYATTFALVEGQPLPGGELDTTALLDVDLLRTDIALDTSLAPLDVNAVTVDAVLDAHTRSWDDTFAARCAASDHIATAAIVAAVTADDAVHGAQLADLRDRALADSRSSVHRLVETLSARLQGARRAGCLDEDTAADLELRIARADDGERLDLGAVCTELDDVDAVLADAAHAAVDEFRARLAEVSTLPAVKAAAAGFDHLLAERDLATAEELLLQLQEGIAQPAEHRPDIDLGAFFPAVVEHLAAGITNELIERARRRDTDGLLDFDGRSPEAAETAASALSAWRAAAVGERQARKAGPLTPALRALGLEYRSERPAPLPSSNDRAWVDLSGVVRVPQNLVPAFGTYAGDTQRLLLVWKQPGESLLEWIEQDPSERPVLVLYFGTMTVDVRRRIANRLRGRHARPVVIVDDAVVAWAASLGRQTFEVTMRATLPFSAVNPYEPGVAGAVPEEMFYGRVAERSAVMNETGTSLIFGGRRLGKSALLRAAERRFNSVTGRVAIYIDLSAAGIRTTRRPEAVWDLVATRLVDAGVAEQPSAKRTAPPPLERTERAVRDWLSGGDARRLLLLLDECDDFFDTDAEADFAQTRRLKDLMESTGRRFKVVFAGLHQVARFASYPNQPLAHLGKPLPIGPLAPQYAHNLIAKPFIALGWRFESQNLINRVLTYCNYTPVLLQEFGHTLIEHLHRRRVGPGEPPATIVAADIDAVLQSGSLDRAIRSRFDLTLSLDPRYKMIAYVLALETHAGAGRAAASTAMTVTDLRDQCREWWPQGFARVNDDEFRALLDELVGLGVLSSDRGAWRMRSPNVLRLLGTKQAIEAGLVELVRENPTPGGLFSGEAHRLVEINTGSHAGRRVRSPFTEQQLADVIGESRNQLRIVIGTAATNVDMVGPVLAASRDLMSRWQWLAPPRPSAFEHAVVDVPARQHRVVFSDLRGVSDEAITRAVAATAKHPIQPGATCSAVIIVDPAALPVVEEALAGVGVEDAAVVALRRYSPEGLRAWAVEVESGFTDDDARRRLAAVTGGWPVLVDEAEAIARKANAHRAVTDLESGMAQRAERLLAELGVADAPLAGPWATVVDLLGTGREPADALGVFLTEPTGGGEATVRALTAAGVLLDDDGLLSVEPVTAGAWRLAQDAAASGS